VRVCGAVLLAFLSLAVSAPARKPGATPTPPPAVRLTPAQKSQAQKVLATEVGKRQSLREKQKAAPKPQAKFQAHRCAIIYDESVSGRQREANGPFRVSCSDWVPRAKKDLSIQDAERPCTAGDYGPFFAGCTAWVDGWDDKRGKWSEVWRKASP
jgi:hypothetical protein